MDDIVIRPARESDITQVMAIQNHYVLKTVITFRTEPSSDQSGIDFYHSCIEKGYPYFVACDRGSTKASSPTEEHDDDVILGFAIAHSFRGSKGGYRYASELSLLCRAGATGKGIGSRLMQALIGSLKQSGIAKQLMAVIAFEEDERTEKLRKFYRNIGFVERGQLKKVGWKFNRWIDTMYFQLDLTEEG